MPPTYHDKPANPEPAIGGPAVPVGAVRWGMNHGWETPDISEERLMLMEQRGKAEEDMYKTMREYWQEEARTRREAMKIEADLAMSQLRSFTDAMTTRMGANATVAAAAYGFDSAKLDILDNMEAQLRDAQEVPTQARDGISELVQAQRTSGTPPTQQDIAGVLVGLDPAQVPSTLAAMQQQGIDVEGLFREGTVDFGRGAVDARSWLDQQRRDGEEAVRVMEETRNQMLHDALSNAQTTAHGVGMSDWASTLDSVAQSVMPGQDGRIVPPPAYTASPQEKQQWLNEQYGPGSFTVSEDGRSIASSDGTVKSWVDASAEIIESQLPADLQLRLGSFRSGIEEYDRRITELEDSQLSPWDRARRDEMRSQAFQDWMAQGGYNDEDMAWRAAMRQGWKNMRNARRADRWVMRDRNRHQKAYDRGLLKPDDGSDIEFSGTPQMVEDLGPASAGDQGAGADIEFRQTPEMVETPGREASAPSKGSATPSPGGIIKGSGGYEYQRTEGGGIKIVKDPRGRATGVVLRSGPAYDAINKEIGGSEDGTGDIEFKQAASDVSEVRRNPNFDPETGAPLGPSRIVAAHPMNYPPYEPAQAASEAQPSSGTAMAASNLDPRTGKPRRETVSSNTRR